MHISVCDGTQKSPYSDLIGVWHRPNSSGRERTLEELCVVIDEFKSAGINVVFLETFYHGKTVFRTDKIPYSSKMKDFTYGDYPDYVTAFVTEASKRGITVHAWVQDFYLGVDDEIQFIKDHPDWMLINQSGSRRHTTEGQEFGGYLFIDPANRAARVHLIDFYDELLTKLPAIQGLNLDYIRYPISIFDEDTDTGYTPVCMTEFAARYGLMLDSENMREDLNRQIKDKGLVDEWTAHRAEYITSFVREVNEMLRAKHAGKLVSTAVFPEIDQTYVKKKQNIRAWLDGGYVDMVTPMVYSYEAEQVFESVKNLKSMCGDIRCYTGLYTTYHKQSVAELSEHIAASRRAGADGFVLFDSAKTFFENTEDYGAHLCRSYGDDSYAE